ncbi:MAG: lipocalin-like domain-containing protein [Nitrospirota bacterium]|nr:lipocalin-like domain-containing protein [Nitrospirota bacterium]
MSRSIALVVALLGLGTVLPTGNAVAGQTLKDQPVGTWMLVSWDEMKPDGTKIPPLAGINPKGIVMFDANGHISFQAVAALPKISSYDRRKMMQQEAEGSFEVAQRRCPNGRC